MKKILLLVFLCIGTFGAFAGKQLKVASNPSWLIPVQTIASQTVNEREVSSGYYYLLVDEQTNVDEEVNYSHVIRKIVNESGVQANSQITISFVPEFQQLFFHSLNVRRDGKVINHLDLSRIKVIQQESELGDNIYSGISDALIILEDLRKGDEIEYAYSIKGSNPIFRNKFMDVIQMASINPILSYSKNIIANPNRKFYFKYYNKAPKVNVKNIAGKSVYSWENLYIPAYKTEGQVPDWYVDYPYAEMSEYSNWSDVAKWSNTLLHNYNHPLPVELNQKIKQWKAQKPGDNVYFVQQATRFVQDQIRYQGMEIGPNTHLPYSPAEVYKKRYGDCKDKALLLACILRSQQIPAWVCLVNTGWKRHLKDHLPGANMFDHAIVKTIIDNKPIWIDATISQQRGPILSNYLPIYETGLTVSENTAALESITTMEISSIIEKQVFEISENIKDKVQLNVSTTYNKNNADYFRAAQSANSVQDLESEYEKYYNRIYTGTKLENQVAIEDDTINNIIKTEENYAISKFWEEKNNGVYKCEVDARSIYDRLTNPQNAGTDLPLALSYPVDIHQTIILNFETAWEINDEPFEIKTDEYYFSFKHFKEGNQLRVEYVFTTYQDFVPADKVEDYKKDYAKIVDCLAYTFTKNDSGTPTSASSNTSSSKGNLNWMSIILALATLAGSVFLMRHLNRRTTHIAAYSPFSNQIGGWLILLAIVLIIKAGMYAYNFITVDYFRASLWTITTDSGSSSIQAIFLLELLTTVTGFVFCATLIYWFFKRRDIFPDMLIVLALFELGFTGIELVYGLSMQSDIKSFLPNFTKDSGTAFFRGLLFLAIWGGALRRSSRSKYTFTQTYNSRKKEFKYSATGEQ